MHIRSVHINKLSLWLNSRTVMVVSSLPRISSPYSTANVQYPVGQGASAQAAQWASHGIQPADELTAHGT